MPSPPHQSSGKGIQRGLACAVALWLCSQVAALAQVPNINAGPDSGFAQMDFAQMYLDQINRRANKTEQQRKRDKELIDSGAVSALDLEAPNRAVVEFNSATALMKAQHAKEAIRHLQRAIDAYPKFVAAHIALGLAYLDQEERSRATGEFETAAKLDGKFPGAFLNLGMLALSMNDFEAARPELEKAAALRPQDTKILCALAYARNGTHQYRQTLETAKLVHTLNHKGMANVHYVAASAAMSLKDFDAVERELNFFIGEDPNQCVRSCGSPESGSSCA